MITQEALGGLDVVVDQYATVFDEKLNEAAVAREHVVSANAEVGAAEENLKAAQKRVQTAKRGVITADHEKQAAERGIESAAKDIAVAIAREPNLDPVAKTLASLVYTDRSLAWKDEPDIFKRTIERGRAALGNLGESLKVGEPILFLGDYDFSGYTAGIVGEETLVATPPVVEEDVRPTYTYVSLEGGALTVNLPDGKNATKTTHELVVVKNKPEDVTLMSDYYEHDIDRLEAATSNRQWLLVGHEAIAAKVAQLEPVKQLVAATALTAAGVELGFDVDSGIKQSTEDKLVELLAFLAAGTGRETTTHGVTRRDAWTGGSYRTQVTKDTPLSSMAKSVDKNSIRQMARTIGLTKDQLKVKAAELLQGRVAKDDASLDQLAKDVKSLGNLDQILDTIFA